MMRSTLLVLILLAAPAAATDALFDSDEAWNLLNTATVREKIEDDLYLAVKDFPAPLREAAEDFTVQGFLIPIWAEAELSAFMLVQDPENCPFCGTGSGYAPVLEVHLAEAIPAQEEFTQIRVRGELELIEDPLTYQMFRMVDARAVH